MMMLLAISIFGAAFGVALYAILGTILPRIDRIADALARRPQFAATASDLVLAERRRAVVRWSAQSRAATPHWRAAA